MLAVDSRATGHLLVRLPIAVGRSNPICHGSILPRLIARASSPHAWIRSIQLVRSPRVRTHTRRSRGRWTRVRPVNASPRSLLRAPPASSIGRSAPRSDSGSSLFSSRVRVTSFVGLCSCLGPNEPGNGNLMPRVASFRDFRPTSQLTSI